MTELTETENKELKTKALKEGNNFNFTKVLYLTLKTSTFRALS